MARSSSTTHQPPWYTHLTLDFILHILSITLCHPFIAFLLPLCLLALATPLWHPSVVYTSAWFVLVCAYHLLAGLSESVARKKGPRRPAVQSGVSAENEDEGGEDVVVITGGASGLGKCVAEIYGIRGANVAVLDLDVEEGEDERGGVRTYKCDVGNRAEVETVWARVVADVRFSFHWHVLVEKFMGQRTQIGTKRRTDFLHPLVSSWGYRQF